jgi:hypothetical protein
MGRNRQPDTVSLTATAGPGKIRKSIEVTVDLTMKEGPL